MPDFRDVDPRELRLPPARRQCSPLAPREEIHLAERDEYTKLYHFPWVYEGADGELMLYHRVTRAARIARLAPGALIRVEVIGKLPRAFAADPKIGDVLP